MLSLLDEVLVAELDDLGMLLEKAFKHMTPGTPISAYIQNDALARPLGFCDGRLNISSAVTLGVVLEYRYVAEG